MQLSPQSSSQSLPRGDETPLTSLPSVQPAPEHPLTGAVVLCLMMLPLLLGVWALSFAPFDDLLNRDGKPLIVDFVCFYTAGTCVNEGEIKRIYNDAWADEKSIELFPSLAGVGGIKLPYRYPPIVAVLVSPLARFDYPTACFLFLTICCMLLLGTFALWRQQVASLQKPGRLVFYAACFGFPAVLESLIGGQLSVFTFVFVSLGILLLKQGQEVSAGVLLGFTAFKPNVAILLILGLAARYPRMFIGLLASGMLMLLANVVLAGTEVLGNYVELMRTLSSNPWETAAPYWKIQGLQPYFELLVGSQSKKVTLLTGVALVVPVVYFWRRNWITSGDAMSLLLIVNALFGMYVPIYDLILLLPVIFLQAEELQRREQCRDSLVPALIPVRFLPAVAMLIVVGPHLSQAVVYQTGGQIFSPLLLCAILLSLIVSICSKADFKATSHRTASVESV